MLGFVPEIFKMVGESSVINGTSTSKPGQGVNSHKYKGSYMKLI